ncbi:MAG: hypothetical protein ABIO57_04065 [Candidatus Paceibacterota bacterium]
MKKVLHTLVASGGILLHGSSSKFDEVHPHYTDNELAICATPFPEIAITMAVLRSCGLGQRGYTASINKNSCNLVISVCEKVLADLLYKNPVGYVYALDASYFLEKRDAFEYRAYNSLYVQQCMRVTKAHLPFFPIEGQTSYKVPLNRSLANLVN